MVDNTYFNYDGLDRYVSFLFSQSQPSLNSEYGEIVLFEELSCLIYLYSTSGYYPYKTIYNTITTNLFQHYDKNYKFSFPNGLTSYSSEIYFDKNKIYEMIGYEPKYFSIITTAYETISNPYTIDTNQWCTAVDLDNHTYKHWCEISGLVDFSLSTYAAPDPVIYGNSVLMITYEILDFKGIFLPDKLTIKI